MLAEAKQTLPVKLILCPLSRAEVKRVELSTGKNDIPWDSSNLTASLEFGSPVVNV